MVLGRLCLNLLPAVQMLQQQRWQQSQLERQLQAVKLQQ